MSRHAATKERELWTPVEVAKSFRLRPATVYAAVKAGLLRHATRHRAGRTCYLIPIADARRMWGAK